MPSLQIPSYFTTEFSSNWEPLLQQMESRLASSVTSTSFTGKRKKFNQLDVGSMTEVTTRKGDTPDGDSTGLAYWIYRRKFEFVKRWDEDDDINLGQVVLPTSDEQQSAAMAYNRTRDAVLVQAAFGTRFIGENGTEEDAFPATQDVAVNYVVQGGTPANSGLTVEKIIKTKELFDAAEVPDGERYFVTGSKQITDMLNTTKITNGDYVQVKALVEGKVNQFCGFNFIRYEDLPVASSVRSCLAFHKTGLKFADMGKESKMDYLPERRHQLQLRVIARMAGVRTQNKKVARIYCDENLSD